ncbi:hypothetical protein [Escherichia phage PH1062]|nr:hypothetical protein [Escherichia phage PH1062]
MSTKVRIADDYNEQAEIEAVKIHSNDRVTFKVRLDFNPHEESYPSTYMLYTPDQARQLACHLMEAAHRAEKGVL